MKSMYGKNNKYDNQVLSKLLRNGLSTNEIVVHRTLKNFKDLLFEHLAHHFSDDFDIYMEDPKRGSGYKIYLICRFSDMRLIGVEIKNHEISFINGDNAAILLDGQACFEFIGSIIMFWNDKRTAPESDEEGDDDNDSDDTPDFEWL